MRSGTRMETRKRREYTAAERKAVLADVRRIGVSETATKHGVAKSCVSRWGSAAGVKREVSGRSAAARDHFLAPLRAQREKLRKEPDVAKILMECVVQGMATDRNLERTFWLDLIVETIRAQPEAEHEQRFLYAARLIEASFIAGPHERHDAVRFVADHLVHVT